MNLCDLRARDQDLFHPTQDWFLSPIQQFMLNEITSVPSFPKIVEPSKVVPMRPILKDLPSAGALALLFARDPFHPIWKKYLWTCDTDNEGQQVFVGVNGRGFEIHRHLHLTTRWAVPLWL